VDQSADNGLLRRAIVIGRARRRSRTAPAGRVTAGRPSQRKQLRLEGPDTLSAHLIPVVDRQMKDSCLMKSRGLMHRRRGLGPTHCGPILPVF
jgi:hypothetical protein